MIDHLLGRPSNDWKRTQVFLVLLFWTATVLSGNKNGPPFVRWFSKHLRGKLTPWQVLAGTVTCLYAVKNADAILGLQAPEPLARLYSRDFYRATWIVTALDTGFATAMHVKPKWIRDILSMLFSGYYLLFAQEADEKLRKYRAVCTVEMLRATWEKTSNPFIRALSYPRRPYLIIKRKILLPRPTLSPYRKPIAAILYYAGTDEQLATCRDLILDVPGGGFVCMDPSHHDDRLHYWAQKLLKPVLAVDYNKAPEYPYPYAMHECFDVYRLLYETKGSVIGMRQNELRIVMTGDSAGANIGAAALIKILEMPPESRLPLPVSVIWTYPALDFNFTSFMPPEHLKILRQESSSGIRGIAQQKDHLKHQSPLSVVDEPEKKHQRRKSWRKSYNNLPSVQSLKASGTTPPSPSKRLSIPSQFMRPLHVAQNPEVLEEGEETDVDEEKEANRKEESKSISERVQYWNPDRDYAELGADGAIMPERKQSAADASTLGTRLTMTSRTGFFNDRIISPSMMRAMAICYVGPRASPDLSKNYYISPILTPPTLLAQFPPVYLLCGERDPFSDDTLIFAGRLRDAKLARKAEAQVKASHYGEGLRMSSSLQAKRDPILDEVEDDWVTTRFIEGWSHGFMQMVTILPKVEHFFALTADWAASSFINHEARLHEKMGTALGLLETGPLHQDNTSENDSDVLSFMARRRGSRTSSPFHAASISSHLQQTAHNSSSPPSSSTSDTNCSTAPTSVVSLDVPLQNKVTHTFSSSDYGPKVGPVQRVLLEEVEISPKVTRSNSDPTRASTPNSTTPARRRGSDACEIAIAASTFVPAQDLLKRRREDAVHDLGSALASDDSDVDHDHHQADGA